MTEPDGRSAPPEQPPRRPEAGEMRVRGPRRRWWLQISPVWLIPIVALVVSLGVALNSYSNRGRLISVRFDNASGIEAGSTVLKYRDVTVGRVEQVGFSSGLNKVDVQIRIAKDVAPYVDADAQFWVIRPEVSVRGVTGLDTVLSGAYIAGNWDSEQGETQVEFEGLESAPLITGPGRQGLQVTLRMQDGNQLAAGAPVLYHGIEVGSLGTPRLSEDGSVVEVDAIIQEAYANRVTNLTRFWDTSGFEVNVGSSGISLDVRSLASLIEGGVSFDTTISGGTPIEPGQSFDVFDSEAAARDSLFSNPMEQGVPLTARFDGSVAGLGAKADVIYRGLKVGEVTDLTADVTGEGAARRVTMQANLQVQPGRLGLSEEAVDANPVDVISSFVRDQHIRARLATGSILTGSLVVELIEDPEQPSELDLAAKPYPMLPGAPANVQDFATTSQGMISRINNLPIEELMRSAIDTLDSVKALASDDGMRRLPESAASLLDDTKARVNSQQITDMLNDFAATAASARGAMQRIEQGQAIDKLIASVGRLDGILANVDGAAQDFPEISEQVRQLSAKLNTIPVEELSTSANRLVQSADAILSTEGARQLPASLSAALDEVRVFLGQVREGGAIENANGAISAAEEAANAIRDAARTLPQLSDRLNVLIANANGLVSGYGDQSRFNTEVVNTLRELQRMAENVATLARTIDRNPQSFILGR
ncbi:MlaD family protein [Frigidibacter sp. MR17.14]|uniref:PqiB family protein n=1 Tax=Frigidibacter sp. MR17.14 TaxID=3126509 RepID=UPI003012D5FC